MTPEMTTLFQMMKSEMDKQTQTITQNLTNTLLRAIDDKIKPILEENENMREEIQTLKMKNQYLEDANRKNNIIIHGIQETENSYEDLFRIIENILHTINIKFEKCEINKYYRLGRRTDEKKNRPILLSLTSYLKKAEIMKNKTKMPKNSFITEDFSKETIQLRKNLQEQVKQEREKGNEAYIRNNKLVVKKNTEAENRKRDRSISPETIHTPLRNTEGKGKNIIAPSKLHKTDVFAYMRARSHSLSEKNTQQNKL